MNRLQASLYGVFGTVISGLVWPYLSLYLVESAGYTVTQASQLLGFSIYAKVFSRFAIGSLLDRFDSGRALVCGMLLATALPIAIYISSCPIIIFAGLCIYSLGNMVYESSVTTKIYGSSASSNEKRASYGYYYTSFNAAFALMPLLVLALHSLGYSKIFLWALFVHIIICFGLMIANRGKTDCHPGVARSQGAPAISRMVEVFRNPAFITVFVFGFFYSIIYAQYFTSISYVVDKIRIFERYQIYPVMVGINGFSVIIFHPVYQWAIKWLKTGQLLLIGSVALTASFTALLLYASNSVFIIIFALTFSLAEVFLNLSITDLLMTAAPSRDRAIWLNLFALSRVSNGIGIAVGGSIYQSAGPLVLTAFLMATSLVMWPLSFRISSRERGCLEEPPAEAT